MTGRGLAVALLACVLSVTGARAQGAATQAKQPYAVIIGTVYDPDETPVYGAVVWIRRADGAKVKGGEKLISDRRGEFALRLPAAAADYVVHVEWKTNRKLLIGEALVHVTFDERVDVGVHLKE